LTGFEYESLFGETFGILELYLEQGKFQYYMRMLARGGDKRGDKRRGGKD